MGVAVYYKEWMPDLFGSGWSEAKRTVHVACAIRGDATLVHGIQRMNDVKEIAM